MTHPAVSRAPSRDLAYYQGKLTAEYLEKSRYTLVHYDVIKKEVTIYAWPVIQFYALKPPLWQDHRATHAFRFPCCLCPSQSFGGDGEYKETNVEKAVEGHYAGKWIATCALHDCPYFACLDEFVGKSWVGTKEYPILAPPVSEANNSAVSQAPTPASQTRRSRDKQGRAIRLALMRSSYRVGCFNLWKLESHSRPGLTASEFYKLFTQCRCGMIMTRRVFWRHRCQFTVIELNSEGDVMVDLTLTDSDSTTSLID